MINNLSHSYPLKRKPTISFIGAEMREDVAREAYLNMPKGSTIFHGRFRDVFETELHISKTGVAFSIPKEKVTHRIVNFIWLDCCITATPEGLNDFAKTKPAMYRIPL